MTSPADAFVRAARHSPLFQPFRLFVATLDHHDRPTTAVVDWLSDARGALRWGDRPVDVVVSGRDIAGSGDGVLTLFTPDDSVPDMIETRDGAWLLVVESLGRDALGAGLRLSVRRHVTAPPTVRAAPP